MLSPLESEGSSLKTAKTRAVFMDKDGTLIHDVPYNVDPTLIRWMPGAEEALRMLSEAGYDIVVVSNQSGVARGYFEERALIEVEQTLRRMVLEAGAELKGFFYCPHDEDVSCDCRKPMPGLILRAAREYELDTTGSWLVGDILSDVEAGNRAGCRSILVGDEPVPVDCAEDQRPFARCQDLLGAVDIILKNEEQQA
jgi:histidinol-phosphate phosphatase family protein